MIAKQFESFEVNIPIGIVTVILIGVISSLYYGAETLLDYIKHISELELSIEFEIICTALTPLSYKNRDITAIIDYIIIDYNKNQDRNTTNSSANPTLRLLTNPEMTPKNGTQKFETNPTRVANGVDILQCSSQLVSLKNYAATHVDTNGHTTSIIAVTLIILAIIRSTQSQLYSQLISMDTFIDIRFILDFEIILFEYDNTAPNPTPSTIANHTQQIQPYSTAVIEYYDIRGDTLLFRIMWIHTTVTFGIISAIIPMAQTCTYTSKQIKDKQTDTTFIISLPTTVTTTRLSTETLIIISHRSRLILSNLQSPPGYIIAAANPTFNPTNPTHSTANPTISPTRAQTLHHTQVDDLLLLHHTQVDDLLLHSDLENIITTNIDRHLLEIFLDSKLIATAVLLVLARVSNGISQILGIKTSILEVFITMVFASIILNILSDTLEHFYPSQDSAMASHNSIVRSDIETHISIELSFNTATNIGLFTKGSGASQSYIYVGILSIVWSILRELWTGLALLYLFEIRTRDILFALFKTGIDYLLDDFIHETETVLLDDSTFVDTQSFGMNDEIYGIMISDIFDNDDIATHVETMIRIKILGEREPEHPHIAAESYMGYNIAKAHPTPAPTHTTTPAPTHLQTSTRHSILSSVNDGIIHIQSQTIKVRQERTGRQQRILTIMSENYYLGMFFGSREECGYTHLCGDTPFCTTDTQHHRRAYRRRIIEDLHEAPTLQTLRAKPTLHPTLNPPRGPTQFPTSTTKY